MGLADDALQPLNVLRRRTAEVLDQHGLMLVQFGVFPNDHGPSRAQLVVVPKPEFVKVEKDEFDDIIEADAEHTATQRRQERADAARDSLIDLAKDLEDPKKGFL